MPGEYLPIFVLVALAAALALAVALLPALVAPRRPTPAKLTPYESGIVPLSPARRRIRIRFYLVAMLFIVFDVEVVFLYPWAVVYRQLGLFGLVEMVLFISILLVGYFYVWKKGAFEWE